VAFEYEFKGSSKGIQRMLPDVSGRFRTKRNPLILKRPEKSRSVASLCQGGCRGFDPRFPLQRFQQSCDTPAPEPRREESEKESELPSRAPKRSPGPTPRKLSRTTRLIESRRGPSPSRSSEDSRLAMRGCLGNDGRGSVAVEARPMAAGLAQTTLTVMSTAPGSPHSIGLSGTGVRGVLPL
jgi:hypothetical protein